MEICLSHWSALQAWRHVRALGPEFTLKCLEGHQEKTSGITLAATPQELRHLKNVYNIKHIEVLVGSLRAKHQRHDVTVRYPLSTRMPGSAAELEPGLLAVDPECCFMQLTSQLSLLGLIALGFELCSIYTLNLSGSLVKSVPLTTIDKLANSLPLASNRKRAEQSLDYILERSFSPRETESAIKLTLPHRLGGFAQRGMLLNHEIVLSGKAAETCGKAVCFPDMLFPDSKFAFEYAGKFHSEIKEDDELRRIALESDGYRIERINYELLRDRDKMLELANIASIANSGRSLRIRHSKWEERSRELFNTLSTGVHVTDSPTWK